MNYELVIFDLDGTLLNTSEGIFRSVRYAEKNMNLSPVLDNQLPLFVGPPPAKMYQQLYGLDKNTAFQAAQYHREYSRKQGLYEAELYEGVTDTLNYLKAQGIKLAVATLKSQEIAEKILEFFQIRHFFNAIVGMDNKESLTKADTIKMTVKFSGTVGKSVLVGDSIYDLEGAKEAGVDFIGVLYGFGFHKREAISPYLAVEKIIQIIQYL